MSWEKQKSCIRSKCYSKNISKDKWKKANFRKFCKNFKIVDGHPAYKGKRKVLFDNGRKKIIRTWRIRRWPEGKSFSSSPWTWNRFKKYLLNDFTGISMVDDLKQYVKNCQNCQQQVSVPKCLKAKDIKDKSLPNCCSFFAYINVSKYI